MTRVTAACVLAACAACATAPIPAAPHEPAIVDLTSDFLRTACIEPTGVRFGQAWLAYEKRHWALFERIYYRWDWAIADRDQLAVELGPRRDEMCLHARTFMITAPAIIRSMRGEVTKLMGSEPLAAVYLPAALQWTDGRADAYDGQEIIVLNTRHDTFARTTGLVTTIAHELIHDAQSRVANDEALPPVARSLYREGAAVFGVQQILPGLGRRALGMKSADRDRATSVATIAAKVLLENLETTDVEDGLMRRFFSGGIQDPQLPPKMGYYLGNEIYTRIGAELGVVGAVRIRPDAFIVHARRVLSDIAARPNPPEASAPR